MMNRDIVFIDTSIFVAENFFTPKNRISALKDLVHEGLISIVSTEVTNREVKRRFIGETTAAMNYIKNHLAVLCCFEKTEILSNRDFKKQIIQDAEKKISDFLKDAQVYTIGFDQCGDIEPIFDKYFKKEKPFAEGAKEKEFPDAFALQMLEKYCEKNKLKIRLLSADADMMKYASEYLIPTDYKQYLTEKGNEAETLERIKRAIIDNKDRLESEIENRVIDELADERLYYGIFNAEDISDIDVQECVVEIADDFSVVSKDNGNYVIELQLTCKCKVECSYFSLDYAFYDREDDKWYGVELESDTVDGESYFSIQVRYLNDNGVASMDIDKFDIDDAVPSLGHAWER